MLRKTTTRFSLFFFSIVIIELICDSNPSLKSVHYFAKPAIVISLLFYFIRNSQHLNSRLKNLTILGLVFSVVGDILLMFVDASANYFILGLAAFLCAHIMYILVFLKHRNDAINPIWLIFILLVYGSGLFYLLNAGLGDLLIPVIVYMIVILTMGTTAYLRKNKVTKASFNWVLIGAILFMISDSILALNKFYQELWHAPISIMLTYAMAQYCITFGILKLKPNLR
ncbi:lysoplasmalogenase [Flavobacteriales bacterium 34_180_T64]|nr:lysoplasmalogenase [Flavobacteriales bacterium 34_180_T64]